MHVGNENNVKQIMRHCSHCGGSDGILHGQNLHPRVRRHCYVPRWQLTLRHMGPSRDSSDTMPVTKR